MIQILLGFAAGLVLVAFFIAIMYYVLPDRAVNKALERFERLYKDTLNNTIGRVLETILRPVTALTNKILSLLEIINTRFGPVTAFAFALIGFLRASRGLFAVLSPDRSFAAMESMQKATVMLLTMALLGAIGRGAYIAIKELALPPALYHININRYRPTSKINKGKYIKRGYVVSVIILILLGLHAAAKATEIFRPGSDTAKLLRELDLLEKFYLHVIKDIKIR